MTWTKRLEREIALFFMLILQLRKTFAAFCDRLPSASEKQDMAFSKDGDSSDSPILTLVGGSQPAGESAPPEGADKATLVKLNELRQEHRHLDEEIKALVESVAIDQLLMKRLKKRKLMLRDLITRIESEIVPDIIA